MTYLAIAAYLVIVPMYLRQEWRAMKQESLVARIARYDWKEA